MPLIAIAFSDIHIHKWKAFDKDGSRLNYSLEAFKTIAGVAKEKKVPLLFAGDLFHTPVSVDNEVLGMVVKYFRKYLVEEKVRMYAISGNHDMSEKNGLYHKAPSYLHAFSTMFDYNFNLLDYNKEPYCFAKYTDIQCRIWGIPYMNNDIELKKAIKDLKPRVRAEKAEGCFKILLLHGDCPGAINDEGIKVGEIKSIPMDVDSFFKEWDLVLFGHIHVPQKISKKCYMLGAPIHQTSANKVQMGYWKIFNDRPPKFVGLANFPKFRRLKKNEKPDNGLDYFIPHEEIGTIEEVEKGDFNAALPRVKLAKRYMKAKGIKDKKKRNLLINALNEVE